MEAIIVSTEKEFDNLTSQQIREADVVVVNNTVYKTRFGHKKFGDVYNGYLGDCSKCGCEIKERMSFSEMFIGCMC